MTVVGHVRNARNVVLTRLRHGRAPTSRLPLPPVPFRMGGVHFRDDARFVHGALTDVDKLVGQAGLDRESRVLDWGCGAGRLAIGIAERFGTAVRYHGVDVQMHLIRWARRHIAPRTGFRFTHVDAANERYNPTGRADHRVLPASDDAYSIVYAYSVYSHLCGADASAYLAEFRRVLRPGGVAFLTAFVADAVPDETQNPSDYGEMTWAGPLHCVRFNRDYFERMMDDAGLVVKSFFAGTETDGQSLYLLVRPD